MTKQEIMAAYIPATDSLQADLQEFFRIRTSYIPQNPIIEESKGKIQSILDKLPTELRESYLELEDEYLVLMSEMVRFHYAKGFVDGLQLLKSIG